MNKNAGIWRHDESANHPVLRASPSTVKVNVHYFLPHLTHDQEVVDVKGCTVGECLQQLVAKFPESREWVFKNDGLSNLIDVYIKKGDFLPVEISNPVEDGDEIYIVMMISGG